MIVCPAMLVLAALANADGWLFVCPQLLWGAAWIWLGYDLGSAGKVGPDTRNA